MKNWFSGALFLLITCLARADEGLWLPYLLGDHVFADMVKKGLKITREQFYAINKASLKDAAILVNGHASGALISAEGLLLTSLSASELISDENRINTQANQSAGFFAHARQDETACRTCFADQLYTFEDISKEMEDSLKGLGGSERISKQRSAAKLIAGRYSDEPHGQYARVYDFYSANQFLLMVYHRYRDLRLVIATPISLSGLVRDNNPWLWPRYAAGFTLLRIYQGRDGRPAAYSTSNLPLHAAFYFPISIKGYKEGDFTLAIGYPTFSNRYESSLGLRAAIEITGPTRLKLLSMKSAFLFTEMKKDQAINSQLATAYDQCMHAYLFQDGELKAASRANLYDRKIKEEAAFQQWAGSRQEYAYIFRDWEKLYAAWSPYAKHSVYIDEGLRLSPLLQFAGSLQAVEDALVKQSGGDLKQALDNANRDRQTFLRAENKASDMKIMAGWTELFYHEIPKNQHPIGFFESLKGTYGDLNAEASFGKYATAVFSHTLIFDDGRWNAFLREPDATVLQDDPAYRHANLFLKNWRDKFSPYWRQFKAGEADLGAQFQKATRQWDPNKMLFPEANGSLRISYGIAKSYNPGASIHFDFQATMAGLLDQYKSMPGQQALPQSLLDIGKKKDFGAFGDRGRADLVITFVTNNDLSPGLEGAPMLNASGQIIGMVLDGNFEGLDRAMAYHPDFSRTVCVDMRYILWYIEKVGEYPQFVNELTLVKP